MFGWLKSSFEPSLPPGHRVYAVGDVHGRLDLFDRLIESIRQDNAARPAAEVTLILLGDLIDRGPDSSGVVDRARAGVPWARTIAIMGNHEAVMLDVLDGKGDLLRNWLGFGGKAALRSWGVAESVLEGGSQEDILDAARRAVPAAARAWLGRMRPNLRMGDYYFVHAGIRPGVPLDKQIDEDRLWIREDFLESKKKHGAMIVHGHSINTEVEERTNRIGLDTGAYASGRLTAIGLEGRERWFMATAD
jgi:serine/threonine protein phosphatase 1